MKGYVTLTESDIDLFSKAIEVIDNFTPEYVTDYKYRGLRKVEYQAWKHLPTRYRDWETDRKSTRLNSSHSAKSRMPSSA